MMHRLHHTESPKEFKLTVDRFLYAEYGEKLLGAIECPQVIFKTRLQNSIQEFIDEHIDATADRKLLDKYLDEHFYRFVSVAVYDDTEHVSEMKTTFKTTINYILKEWTSPMQDDNDTISNNTKQETLKTQLQNIGNGFEQCCLLDYTRNTEKIRTIYTQVYEVMIQCYEDDNLLNEVISFIHQIANTTLLKLFHKHIRARNLSLLSTWLAFLDHTFDAFRKFYHATMTPLIVHIQDNYASEFMKASNHPFRDCEKCLLKMYEAHRPLILDALQHKLQRYIQCTTDILLTPFDDAEVREVQEWFELKLWFDKCKEIRFVIDDSESINQSLLFYLPTHIGSTQHTFLCKDFYVFFLVLYKKCVKHMLLFNTNLTENDYKKLAVDICCHYDLYNEWEHTKELFSTSTIDTTKTSVFFWTDLYDAFQRCDSEYIKALLPVMCNESSPLSRFHLFNAWSRQSLLSMYAVHVISQLPRNFPSLVQYIDFIHDILIDIVDEPDRVDESRVLHQLHKAIHQHFFTDKTTSQQHEYLLMVCTNKAVATQTRKWDWFRWLWTHTDDKDLFLQKYIDGHLCSAIASRTVHMDHEDTFFLMCVQKCQEECPTQLHRFRSLLNEYHHRSVDKNTFVVNKSVWHVSETIPVVLHPEIDQVLREKTKTHNKMYGHRKVTWCLSNTHSTITLRHPTDGKQSIQITASLFAINLLLWIHSSPLICIGKWVDRLLQGQAVHRSNLVILYKYLDCLVEKGVVITSSPMSSKPTDNICLKLAYRHHSTPWILKNMPNCYKKVVPKKHTETKKTVLALMERQHVIQAAIVHTIKPLEECISIPDLSQNVRKQIRTFVVDETMFQDALQTMVQKEYVSKSMIDNIECVKYLP